MYENTLTGLMYFEKVLSKALRNIRYYHVDFQNSCSLQQLRAFLFSFVLLKRVVVENALSREFNKKKKVSTCCDT